MKKLLPILKRYRGFLALAVANIALLLWKPEIGVQSLVLTKDNLLEMLSVIPPIFLLLGLLDVWVERETMMKLMGKEAGIKGGLLAFLMGSAAAGPLYAAFPIAGILMKKGVSFFNIFLFVGAWSTTKIPMILFETTNLGWRYMLLRLICNIFGIILIAFLMDKSLKEGEKEEIREKAKTL